MHGGRQETDRCHDTVNEHLPHNYQDMNMVVYTGTHDNETIVGYFRDKSDYELAYLYEYLSIHYKEEIPDALIRVAYASIADVAIIQMQDLMKLGNEARMNAPSAVGRNWRWRIGKDENKRAPMYWSTDADATGMCDGSKDMDEVKMKYGSLKEQENDGNSIYNFVKQTIALQNEYPVIARGRQGRSIADRRGASDWNGSCRPGWRTAYHTCVFGRGLRVKQNIFLDNRNPRYETIYRGFYLNLCFFGI